MPRAWSIEELRRFEEIKEGLRAQQRRTPARQRASAPQDRRPEPARATGAHAQRQD